MEDGVTGEVGLPVILTLEQERKKDSATTPLHFMVELHVLVMAMSLLNVKVYENSIELHN